MFSIHVTKLTMNFGRFHVLRIQETDYKRHFTCGGIHYFHKHYEHTALCVNTVHMSAIASVSWQRIKELCAHAHHRDRSAAAAIFANGTYFLDNPRMLVCWCFKLSVLCSEAVETRLVCWCLCCLSHSFWKMLGIYFVVTY